MNAILTYDANALNALNDQQMDVLTRYPQMLEHYLDYFNNGQVPAGTTYKNIVIYVGDEQVIEFNDNQVIEGDQSISELIETLNTTTELTIWANHEIVLLKAEGVVILNRQKLCPL